MSRFAIEHPPFGIVLVTFNRRSSRFVARWKGRQLYVTSPPVDNVDQIHGFLDRMAPRILASRPETASLETGHTVDTDFFSIVFDSRNDSNKVSSRLSHDSMGRQVVVIAISKNIALDNPAAEKVLAKHIRNAAQFFAGGLIDEAKAIALHIGVSPSGWKIGHGANRLGTCGSDGVITLSCMCVFLPRRLREYIVCHELAHLTHFNHSPQFHALCSRYCGGDGDSRRAELKSFKWPVPRR